jgi:hypothetical protein
MSGHGVYPVLTRSSYGLCHAARGSAGLLADATIAAWSALPRRSSPLGPSRTRDELYAQARAIGIRGRGRMTKAELASAVGRATAPTPALIFVQGCRRRAAAIPIETKATLDSLARLTRDGRFSLAPALAAGLRPHKGSASIATLLAALIGGALPVLVYGMNPKSADRTMVARAYPLVKASSPPNVAPRSGAVGRGQSIRKRRDHPGNALPTAGSDMQTAPETQESSPCVTGTDSHAPASSAHDSDEATSESAAAHESASDEEGASSNEESSGQGVDSQGNEQGKGAGGKANGYGNGEGKAKGHDKHDGLG